MSLALKIFMQNLLQYIGGWVKKNKKSHNKYIT